MEKPARSMKMQFILTGFTQELGFRVFAFERMAEDRTRTRWTVRADLALIRRYGIRLQELPLMCRGLLERGDDVETRAIIFSEEQMRTCADERAAAKEGAAHKRKAPRRPASENSGAAWRGPQQH